MDGAVKGDRAKVVAYVEQLVRKLQESGDGQAANRLKRTLDQVKVSEVAATRFDASPRLPVDGESRLSLADEERVSPSDVHVVLEPEIGSQVAEFLRFAKAADRLLASRVGIAPSMIIYGPPGVGKTELARYIASQLDLPLVTGRTDALISSFLGSTAKNLRLLFDHVKTRPCVLFLDELDSLAKLRDDQHELGELKRVVVSLLQNIDALANEVVLLGATNHHHLLDPAVWRRFTYRLELSRPGPVAREKLIELFLHGYECGEDLSVLACVAEGLTGADIRQVCETAIREAVLAGSETVRRVDLLRGMARARLRRPMQFESTEPSTIVAVRDLAPSVFTCKRLAVMFETSEATISRRLNDDEVTNGRRRCKVADKSRDSSRPRLGPAARSRWA